MKTITLEQTGWRISGEATINLWGGGELRTPIKPSFIPLGRLTKDSIQRCINDYGWGCESIERAEVYVSEHYQGSDGSYKICRAFLEFENPNPRLVRRGI